MLKLFILPLLFIFSFAQNPAVYALLGDVVYDNVSDIKKLSDIPAFSQDKEKISEYTLQCEELKEKGFSIESGDTKYDKLTYLNELRRLSKLNDEFIRLANSKFRESMENNDTQTFKELVDLKIVNKPSQKEKLREFISTHEAELQDTQYYATYIDDLEKDKIEQARLKKMREAQAKKNKYSNIERIRNSDKKRQESLQKELQQMVNEKKKEIYKQQKEGLENY